MAGNSRMSTYSNMSGAPAPRPALQQMTQMSTTTLLNALHTSYTSGLPFFLEASTSLVVNTWITATNVGADGRIGGTVDMEISRKAWEHARRRAEDGCIVLGSLHESTPSLLAPFVSALPLSVPSTFYNALAALKPFLHCVTPLNPSLPRHSSFAATFTLSLEGTLTGASIGLSTGGIDTQKGLLQVPAEAGYRAFDVFYYLLTSASTPAEREFLNLKDPRTYSLLNKSGTYKPPSYLPTADDAAAAEDFRESLRAIGIKGASQRNLLSILTALLKLGDSLGFLVDEEVVEQICEEVADLLSLDPEILIKQCTQLEREVLIGGIYEALVDWVILKANEAIRNEMRRIKVSGSSSGSEAGGAVTPVESEDEGDTVSITVVEIPSQSLGKAVAMRTVFDDSVGINAEMKEDGVTITSAGASVMREMKAAVAECEADIGITGGPAGREREFERDRREGVLEKVGHSTEPDSFLKSILYPISGDGVNVGKAGRFDLPAVLGSSRVWYHLCLHPTDEHPEALGNLTAPWSAASVSQQLRTWRLPEWANRRNKQLDFTADFDIDEFYNRYARLGCKEGKDGVESWVMERGWSNGDCVIGKERVWMREGAWWEAEQQLDSLPLDHVNTASMLGGMVGAAGLESGYSVQNPAFGSGFFGPQYGDNLTPSGSRDNLLQRQHSSATMGGRSQAGGRSLAPTHAPTTKSVGAGDYGLGRKGDINKGDVIYDGLDPELGEPNHVEEKTITASRRAWVAFVWLCTFWIPSFMLRYIGRMKRPDVRMAWREKLTLVMLIFFFNAVIVFYIIEFGRLLCPNFDKAWSQKEVSYHQGNDDFWVSYHGGVYDLSRFWRIQHSDMDIETTQDNMQPFAGLNVDNLVPIPVYISCPGFVDPKKLPTFVLTPNTTSPDPSAIHNFGPMLQPDPTSALHEESWYAKRFLPKMKEYYKGELVWNPSTIKDQGLNSGHQWVTIGNRVYDFTDYFNTVKLMANLADYKFLGDKFEDLISENAGTDIKDLFEASFSPIEQMNLMNCMDNQFFVGNTDFRKSVKCQINNYILLAFTIILCTVIGVKFLAALQLGSKRRPAAQDKFVICQVPAYTEGEDQLRKGLDSLTALAYDNKRKLICVICDGMIVGGGNDRPTPKIVLDILGVDPKIDPPALPFKSVGQSSEQLNYGKVYSGLYEYEGNVVPYIVVVKVGKESEQTKSKPGNRGKRDSQILLMSFLNRVHHRSPMNPLELEMFHQINNIIGVDPELYEYLLMVDADTMVKEDSLNRLVASCANDAKIAGICGETSLENEERSWWTMIQVYEYYISHHLSKAFESLFGSVTCLPGCFCMYRLRTADKGRPLIISDKVIKEYADCDVDTLHKKNLLSLGEDRYLTTLMTKHFPGMSYKFIPDAYALTAAPEKWSILLSQRRRWINSTIHNLAELMFLKDMCGFCCFSMRFVVFIDLLGTVILPATCAYIVYLIYRVASRSGQIPYVSIIMLAAVYGLQAIIFIIKRQWQHVGWMIIYLLAYPIYSFALPVYSFWKQDDFSWGNTRIVIGEKGNKQLVAVEDEGFDPRSIPLQRWDDYASANNLPGRRGLAAEKGYTGGYSDEPGYEMDNISVYSSVKPASTILTGFPNAGGQYHMVPPVDNPYNGMQHRQSTYSMGAESNNRLMSMGGMSDHYNQHRPSMPAFPQSSDNLLSPGMGSPNMYNMASPPVPRGNSRSPLGYSATTPTPYQQQGLGMGLSRPVSTVNFQTESRGPSDQMIVEAIRACLQEVDMDTVTKKQLKALTEQRLQTSLQGERKAYLDRAIDVELANM